MENKIDFKELRKDRGWTQQAAADFFGVDKATVWRWENKGIPSRGVVRGAIEREFASYFNAG